jgi:hypothetical protein
VSGKKKQASVNTNANENSLFQKIYDTAIVKDALIFLGWIAAMLFIAGICWVLTQPVRNRILVKAVNRALEQSGDPQAGSSGPHFPAGNVRRLTEPAGIGSSMFMGQSFAMDSGQSGRASAIVFSFIGEGTFFPCVAVISAYGKVEEFIPLTNHGEKILRRISPGILGIYSRRIERELRL